MPPLLIKSPKYAVLDLDCEQPSVVQSLQCCKPAYGHCTMQRHALSSHYTPTVRQNPSTPSQPSFPVVHCGPMQHHDSSQPITTRYELLSLTGS